MWKSNACQAGIMCVYELFSLLCSRALTAITHSAIHRRRVKSEDDEFIFIGSKVVFRTFECVCVCVTVRYVNQSYPAAVIILHMERVLGAVFRSLQGIL